jgi:heptosyltransferase I
MGDAGSSGRRLRDRDHLDEPPRSVLIVMLSAIGDAVLVLPVASALRRTFPELHLSWAIQPGPLSLVRGHPSIHEFIPVDRGDRRGPGRSILKGAKGIADAARQLRTLAARRPGGRFDLVLDLQVYLKAGLVTALTPASVKLGFDRGRSRDLNHLFTTHRIPPRSGGYAHIQDQYFEFLHFIGVDPEPVDYGLALSESEVECQRRFLSDLGRPVCAMVASSSDTRKNWTSEGFAAVAAAVRNDLGLQPILVGGKSPLEEEMARAILDKAEGQVVDARGGGLRRLLWLLDGARVAISPDTGPLHMARAMRTPVVGLFGYTNPKRSGPYRCFTELVVDGYARYPGEEYPVSMERRPHGMERITPHMVMEKVEQAISGSDPGRPEA